METSINPVVINAPQTGIPSTPANNPNGGDKNGGIEIDTNSEFALFKPSLAGFDRLDGIYQATVAKIVVVDAPARQFATGKKPGRKAKSAKQGGQAKAKVQKPVAKNLCVTFELLNKRRDGATYIAVKEITANLNEQSKFGKFVQAILPEPEAQQRFFSDWRPAHLLNRKCHLKIKESRPNDQPLLKILEVLAFPQDQINPETTVVGELNQNTTQQVVGQIHTSVPQAIAA